MASPLFDILSQALAGKATDALSAQLGLDGTKTATAMSMAIPILVSALTQNAGTTGGLSSLENALNRDHDGSILDNIGGYLGGGLGGAIGGKILGHVLGGKQADVQAGISKAAGIDAATVAKMMAMLAPLVLGALSRANKQTPPTTSVSDILTGATASLQQQAPGGGSLLTKIFDRDQDGSAFDDVARMGASVLGSLMRGR